MEHLALSNLYFNTSYVTVQQPMDNAIEYLTGFQYILCYGSTVAGENLCVYQLIFQYILCHGSTGLSLS